VAERAAARSGLRVVRFRSKKELRSWAERIGQAYNQAFVHNWEYYPLTEAEIRFVTDSLLAVADPRLIKIIARGDQAVGFLFAFRDLSAALQRCRGRSSRWGSSTCCVTCAGRIAAINGAGIYGLGPAECPAHSEMEKTIREAGFRHADLTQVRRAPSRCDLETVGGVSYKTIGLPTQDLTR
jgi:hypothetical protein